MRRSFLGALLIPFLLNGAYGTTNVCNSPDAKQTFLKLYQELDTGYRVVDAYDFKTVEFDAERGFTQCEGVLHFDDGDILEVIYTERLNKAGDRIYEFDIKE